MLARSCSSGISPPRERKTKSDRKQHMRVFVHHWWFSLFIAHKDNINIDLSVMENGM
jgi:hypothetical protein